MVRLNLAAVLLVLTGVLMAQSPTGGTIRGQVVDPTGSAVPGARVECTDAATGRARAVQAGASGGFVFPGLAASTYELTAQSAGFNTVQRKIDLPLGGVIEVNLSLAVARTASEVTVQAEPSALAPGETAPPERVDHERIEELPVESRNALDFALIEPGISPARTSYSPLPSSGFSVGGLRPQGNSIAIDGLDNNDAFTGAARTELSPEIVQEYQVISNGYSAANGGAAGGAINVISRSGSNQIHGDAFIFLQNAALDARDPITATAGKPRGDRRRAGLAWGGPLVRNRIFAYAAVEQEHNRGFTDSDIAPANVNAINAALAAGALPGFQRRALTDGFAPTALAETEGSARFDFVLSPAASLMLRYALTNNRQAGDAFASGGLSDAGQNGSRFTRDSSLAGALTLADGANAVNDLRWQYAARHLKLATTDSADPEIAIAGIAAFGTPYQGNITDAETHAQINESYARSAGAHLWTAGVNLNHVGENVANSDGLRGLYDFASLQEFMAGTPRDYRQVFAAREANFGVLSAGVFAEDHWTPRAGWTVDAGVRDDLESLPAGIAYRGNLISPRLAAAYAPTSRWVVRAGYGLFADRQVLANLNRALQWSGAGFEQVAQGAAAARIFQANGGGASSVPALGVAPSVYRTDPQFAVPYSEQAQASAQYLISTNLTATLTAQYVRGLRLPRTLNVNLEPPLTLTPQNASSLGVVNPSVQQLGQPYFGPGRVEPGFDNVYQLEDRATSRYEGITFSINRRMEDELEFMGAYTVSRTRDDASFYAEQPANPFAPANEWARSLQDQRQRLVFDALWELPIGDDADNPKAAPRPDWVTRVFSHFELAPILAIGSGMPANPLVGFDANGGGAYPLSARPVGLGRNSLRLPSNTDLDFRVLKYFPHGEYAHLDVVAEAFNLLNHPNVIELNPAWGPGALPAPGFGAPLRSSGGRRIQFSLDYEF